ENLALGLEDVVMDVTLSLDADEADSLLHHPPSAPTHLGRRFIDEASCSSRPRQPATKRPFSVEAEIPLPSPSAEFFNCDMSGVEQPQFAAQLQIQSLTEPVQQDDSRLPDIDVSGMADVSHVDPLFTLYLDTGDMSWVQWTVDTEEIPINYEFVHDAIRDDYFMREPSPESSTEDFNVNQTSPIYEGASISLWDSVTAILTFALSEHLTLAGLSRLLLLIALHLPKPNRFCTSSNHLFKLLETIDEPVQVYYFCSNCYRKCPTSTELCDVCAEPDRKVNNFISVNTSDHIPILISIEDIKSINIPTNYSRTRWERVITEIDRPYFTTKDNNYDVRHLTAVLQCAILNNSYNMKRGRKHNIKITPEIKTLITLKRKADLNYAKTRSHEDKQEQRKLKKKLNKAIKIQEEEEKLKNIYNLNDPLLRWQTLKKGKPTPPPIPTLKKNNDIAKTMQQKAELLAITQKIKNHIDELRTTKPTNVPKITMSELEDAINQLKKKSAPGFKRTRDIQLIYGNQEIETRTTLKYLGITLDTKLTFTTYITNILETGRIKTASLRQYLQKKKITTVKTRIILYKTLIQPTMTYGLPAWSTATKPQLDKLRHVEKGWAKYVQYLPILTPFEEVLRKMPFSPTFDDYLRSSIGKFFIFSIHHSNTLIKNILVTTKPSRHQYPIDATLILEDLTAHIDNEEDNDRLTYLQRLKDTIIT
ncbi:RNA-directed DNA polymerase from mobile element jockey, partial [Frankliniella fusca]